MRASIETVKRLVNPFGPRIAFLDLAHSKRFLTRRAGLSPHGKKPIENAGSSMLDQRF